MITPKIAKAGGGKWSRDLGVGGECMDPIHSPILKFTGKINTQSYCGHQRLSAEASVEQRAVNTILDKCGNRCFTLGWQNQTSTLLLFKERNS